MTPTNPSPIPAEEILGKFTDERDGYFKLEYMQYEQMRVATEKLRREQDHRNGILQGMLDDSSHTAFGISTTDDRGNPRPAYYALRRTAQPVTVSIDKVGHQYFVYISNDSAEDQKLGGVLKIINKTSTSVIGCGYFSTTVGGGEVSTPVALDISALGDGETMVVEVYGHCGSDRCFYRNGSLLLRPSEVGYTVDREKCKIKFESLTYIHAVMIDGDLVAEDNCFSLLPGEVREIGYRPLKAECDISVIGYTV